MYDRWPIRHNYGEFVKTSHKRLADLQISRAFESDITPEDSVDSNQSPIETYILLVPPRLVGVHENTIGDPFRPEYIPPGHRYSGFADINLSNGWNGPAIAVAAQTPEIYNDRL
ncbi:hypothetical protein HZC27_03845 [Candidatus Roizmanbacteria bacterium]|nr:hypothetical protein [Candidatus Roizmanbacteria bacterium]